jgi:hypothetical protein
VINIQSFRKKDVPADKTTPATAPRTESPKPSIHRDAQNSSKHTEVEKRKTTYTGREKITETGKRDPSYSETTVAGEAPVKQRKVKRIGVIRREDQSRQEKQKPESMKKPKRMRLGKKKKE